MYFPSGWDEALREDRKEREKRIKKEKMRQKLLAVINDRAASNGEKDNARKLLLKFT